MDPWHVYSGMFNILMIEEGDAISKLARADSSFKVIFIFVSVLSFVRDMKKTMLIMVGYYILKMFISPYLRGGFQKEEETLSLDSMQPL